MERYVFDYYYGLEADQFSFFRIPRLLIRDKRFSGLSNDAKLLYGRCSSKEVRTMLSRENAYFENLKQIGHAYVLSIIGLTSSLVVKQVRGESSEVIHIFGIDFI